MLRNMLMDLNNFDESKFMALMKEYYQTYGGKKTCTEEFCQIVEKHAGIDMGWFFDQWIKTNHIPKYKFAYDVNKVGNNKHRVTCRIRQENVPEDFKMWIPVTVDYGDDKSSRFRIFMTGRDAQFDLPDLPLEPEEVIFNDFNSVLCEVEYENYDDLGKK